MEPSRSSAQRGSHPHAGRHRLGRAGVDRLEQRRVGAVGLDQRPGEGPVERLLGRGSRTHAHVSDGAARADLDQLGEVLARQRVVLGRAAPAPARRRP